LVLVPWGHHVQIIDKCKGDRDKALFYVRRTIRNGWSRSVLLNWLSTDLYEREGAAQTNFALTLPAADCDLARQLVKDPQVFEVFGLAEEHREADLKAAIVANIERTLLSLGRGVAFLGREYPVEIGGETKSIDLLFYIVPLHRYLVMEVKTTKYEPADLGQLSGYLAMAESVLNVPGDNPPVGILVCKEHNRVLAKIHLEKLGLPMGVTDYQIKRLLPTQAQLAKCYADAEAQMSARNRGK
jgi:predicted nuclease of restriction endonuclease-like (RecB) superfamily